MEARVEKNVSISLIRMLAMSFIIICHIFQTYNSELAWWFNVGVQVFLIISGYLYSSKDYSKDSPLKILKKQFIKILFPYYLWLPIVILLYSILCPQYLSITEIIEYIFLSGVIEGQGHFWFIPYILFCYLVTPYLFWLKMKVQNYSLIKTSFVYCSLTILYIILSNAFNSYFGSGYIICYFVGYFLGDIFRRFQYNLFYSIFLFSIAILCCILKVSLFYLSILKAGGSIYNIVQFYSHVLLALTLFLALLKCPGLKYNILLRFSDSYSYYIFIVHTLFTRPPLNFLYITNFISLNILIAVICIIITGVLYKNLCKSISNVLFLKF